MSTQIVHAPSIEARIDSHRYLWNARLETSEAYVHGAKDGNVDGLEAINPISRSNETANLTHSHIPSNGNALSSPLSPWKPFLFFFSRGFLLLRVAQIARVSSPPARNFRGGEGYKGEGFRVRARFRPSKRRMQRVMMIIATLRGRGRRWWQACLSVFSAFVECVLARVRSSLLFFLARDLFFRRVSVRAANRKQAERRNINDICVRYDRKFGKIFFQNRRFVRINYRKRTHSCSFSDTKQWGKNEQNEYHERIKGVLT